MVTCRSGIAGSADGTRSVCRGPRRVVNYDGADVAPRWFEPQSNPLDQSLPLLYRREPSSYVARGKTANEELHVLIP